MGKKKGTGDARSKMEYMSPEWVRWTTRMMAEKENHELKKLAQARRYGEQDG